MMKIKRKILRKGKPIVVILLTALTFVMSGLPILSVGRTDNLLRNAPPFDFSDDFYIKNGVDFNNILGRPGNPDRPQEHWVLDGSNTDPNRRGVRILETTGGWDKDGNLIYYSIMGGMVPATFTNDAAGVRARALAEDFRAFLFPKTTRNADGSVATVRLDPAPPNRRQDNVFDTKNSYFCQNLLGLWLITMVVYTKDGYNAWVHNADRRLKRILQGIADRNGTDIDGTPILNTVGDIERLQALGAVELRFNPEGGPPAGADGPRWVI
jgi:hypothetical protein